MFTASFTRRSRSGCKRRDHDADGAVRAGLPSFAEPPSRRQRSWQALLPEAFGLVVLWGMAAAMVAVASYGIHESRRPVDAYLSSPMAESLRRHDQAAFAKLVESLTSVDAKDVEGMTPLLVAVQAGEAWAAEYLLARGADPNGCCRGTTTPLTAALERADLVIAEALLRRGADPGRMTDSGDTPLLAAARSGVWDAVQLLLARHVALMPRGIFENPLSCFAFRREDSEKLRRLLAAGADPNRPGRNGEIPLVFAAASNCPTAVAILLKAGADPNHADGKGRTAWSAATNYPDVAAALRDVCGRL
jgi:ankyrin repeat protein